MISIAEQLLTINFVQKKAWRAFKLNPLLLYITTIFSLTFFCYLQKCLEAVWQTYAYILYEIFAFSSQMYNVKF